jgi:predicted nucleic acid-binding protein
MKLLLDTSVLIDVLRARKGRRVLLSRLIREGHSLSTSVLNIAELYAGMRSGEEARTEEFLSGLVCLNLSASAARLAGQLKNSWQRKGRTLTLSATIIAAITIEHRCVLFTDNRKDFPMPEISLYPLP